MDFDSLRPVFSGLVGCLAVYLLARAGRKPTPRKDNVRVLTYGIGFRVFAAILVPGSLFIAYAAAHARPSQAALAGCIAAAFVAGAVFFAYQAFFVSFAYDEHNVYYRTPLAGSKVIPWSEVEELAYSGLLQSHYLRTRQVRRIWCSNMLRGYDELGEFLSRKREELYGDGP
ncbi:hypothetical protein HLB44_21095 [Aquincola sp. S2]|uniref:Uncharacterized protein n=1 Tax=Pseudaquabacterium terrae TaxID=2732868 RepID=A0ABX2ELM5_9BURK|nr:hypothetical protein [Aquabacterium terrae]NRF69503.1 hypothetical protein [Aquabacterium terrae]